MCVDRHTDHGVQVIRRESFYISRIAQQGEDLEGVQGHDSDDGRLDKAPCESKNRQASIYGPQNQVCTDHDYYIESEREQVGGESQAEKVFRRSNIRGGYLCTLVIDKLGSHVELGEPGQGICEDVSEAYGFRGVALRPVDIVDQQRSPVIVIRVSRRLTYRKMDQSLSYPHEIQVCHTECR